MTSLPHARQVRASLRRAKAGGERFLGGVLPGATSRRLQTRAFADEWAAANLDARRESGPLWVVLGDSTSLGIGATTRDAGYVGVAHQVLRRRAAWRVVNLSRPGAGIADVLGRQLPELAELTSEDPAELVTCVVGAEDVIRRTGGLDVSLRSLIAALPRGAVLATVALRGPAADAANRLIRDEAVPRGLRLVDLGVLAGQGERAGADLNDVGHAAWARVLVQAIDNPLPNSDPTPPHGVPLVVGAVADGSSTALDVTATDPGDVGPAGPAAG